MYIENKTIRYKGKNRTAAERRHRNAAKARSKQKTARAIYGTEWYENLHQYSKNKIHCSCWLCSFHGQTISDMRRNDAFEYGLAEL